MKRKRRVGEAPGTCDLPMNVAKTAADGKDNNILNTLVRRGGTY